MEGEEGLSEMQCGDDESVQAWEVEDSLCDL